MDSLGLMCMFSFFIARERVSIDKGGSTDSRTGPQKPCQNSPRGTEVGCTDKHAQEWIQGDAWVPRHHRLLIFGASRHCQVQLHETLASFLYILRLSIFWGGPPGQKYSHVMCSNANSHFKNLDLREQLYPNISSLPITAGSYCGGNNSCVRWHSQTQRPARLSRNVSTTLTIPQPPPTLPAVTAAQSSTTPVIVLSFSTQIFIPTGIYG